MQQICRIKWISAQGQIRREFRENIEIERRR